ncbi:hypothetical protein [Methanobacterium formicicum]|uniref:CopG family transcriptional regulator n=1 Tax=Methanobacterium formicicum TaxID=2162 RepID=A0A843AKD4_METFO|nr:hypothetical protein [Methanobacterium formicicum]MBF4474276.1 hypothetical protein [Methanobacterium formicicum]
MFVSKTVSIKVDDLLKIKRLVENGLFMNVSDFVQVAIKNQIIKLDEG